MHLILTECKLNQYIFIIFIFHLKDRGEIFTTRWKYYHTVCETT